MTISVKREGDLYRLMVRHPNMGMEMPAGRRLFRPGHPEIAFTHTDVGTAMKHRDLLQSHINESPRLQKLGRFMD